MDGINKKTRKRKKIAWKSDSSLRIVKEATWTKRMKNHYNKNMLTPRERKKINDGEIKDREI